MGNTQENKIYVIGSNNCGQLGLHNVDTPVLKLTKWNNKNRNISVKEINCLNDTTIFTDINNNYWITGYHAAIGTNDKYNQFQSTCKKIKYFKNNNIKINKIFTNLSGSCIFWMSDKNKLYGNGQNISNQLGFKNDTNDYICFHNIPKLINSLHNVIDIRCAASYSIALCKQLSSIFIIIRYWLPNIFIPNEIIKIIEMFCDSNSVYLTGHFPYSGNGRTLKNKIWQTIEKLNDKNIVKIRSGYTYSLFLSLNGDLYGFGVATQLGIGKPKASSEKNKIFIPTKIEYFAQNNIKIKDFQCGHFHTLLIDYNGNVYSWGDNYNGQCGNGTTDTRNTSTPKLVNSLQSYNIINIKCGVVHSYAMSDNNDHFLWGSNYGNICSLSNIGQNKITEPFKINKIFENISNCKVIKNVYLASYTMIVAGN